MNWKCRMKGLMVFWAVLRNIYLKREGLRVPVTIVWPLEAFCCSSHIWGELRSLWVDGHNSYEPVIYIYCIYNDIFDLAQGSVTKMKNLTRMMSSFLTLTGLCACLFFSLFFFLWHQYSSAQSFLIHKKTSPMLFLSGLANSSVFFLLLKQHNVDQKCIRWFNVTCHVCTVFSVSGVMALRWEFTMCDHWKHIRFGG